MKQSLHEKMMRLHDPSQENGSSSRHSGTSKNLATYKVALMSKHEIAENTYVFYFKKPEGFQFKAGQHLRMTLIHPAETDEEGSSRFLSIASTPDEAQLSVAMRMRDTAFKRVLGALKIGETVQIQIMRKQMHGTFSLHDDVSKPAVFLAGGIGIVPAYSIIKDAFKRKTAHKIFLFYANRRPEDAPFLSELQDLAKQNPNFKLIATMTKLENSKIPWNGEKGFIDQLMLRKYVKNPQSCVFYVAGLPKMASAMQSMLAGIGISKDVIHTEEFDGFNLNEINNEGNAPRKSWALISVIVMGLLLLVLLHATAGASIFKAGMGIFSFKNPLFYFMIALMVAIAAFKLQLLARLTKRKNR